jgi:hypothetical protein
VFPLDGELSRNGTFLRWNLTPTHCAFRTSHLLLFDEAGGRTEVRDINSGKMCEIIVEDKGTKAVRATRMDADLLIIGPKGLKQIVEVSEDVRFSEPRIGSGMHVHGCIRGLWRCRVVKKPIIGLTSSRRWSCSSLGWDGLGWTGL